jgi:hypothetical protein
VLGVAQGALPDDPRARRRRYLLRDLEPPGAVKAIAEQVRLVLVIGSPKSSNSLRLVEVAVRVRHLRDADPARRRHRFRLVRWRAHAGYHRRRLGARSAGPRSRRPLATRFDVTEREVETVEENIVFKLPRGLEAPDGRLYAGLGGSAGRFLARFDVGELVSAKGIAEGVENSNYLVDTTKGRFILTLYEKRVAADDLPYFMALLDHLADARQSGAARDPDRAGG